MARASWIGVRQLKSAFNRNPNLVKSEARKSMQRAMAHYKRGIIRSPWTLQSSGGGAPVASGNLRDTHQTRVRPFKSEIAPDIHGSARYAEYIIRGTRRMKARPYLAYVKRQQAPKVEAEFRGMLKIITKDLSR